MGTIKAILFDKDGTLMDFHSIWVKVAEEVVTEFINRHRLPITLKTAILSEIGVDGEFVDPYSALAAGTSKDLAHLLQKHVPSVAYSEVHEWVSESLFSTLYKQRSHMKMTANLPKLLTTLKEKNYIVGIVTADDYASTELFLQQYELQSFFDFIVTSDTFPVQKPNKQIVEVFCSKFNIRPNEVVIVGDTPTDLHLAKNSGAGYGIGVLSGTGDEKTLAPLADVLLPSVEELILKTGKFVWEETSFIYEEESLL
ncbi:haloacid dehalogenase [Bacillus manliponensis]|uniref:Haloacid dehalogenase n=1 Tax=Bacillus manliponensis TaxID=574376 RepID=A0A073JYE5_9BACI|nr:HAD family hydrolase [Bacillus manliponensis]KEK19237.1 haloacid dehalogenase [Bacillus manliponensis]